MAEHRTRKNKEETHYPFLISWQPETSKNKYVKGNLKPSEYRPEPKVSASEKADILAKAEANNRIKKDILRSIILVSFILALEMVIYLAWIKFGVK